MIVIVDDEPLALEHISQTLKSEGYSVNAFESANGALDYLNHHEAQLIISDICMPEMDGFAFQKQCAHLETPFIFLSSLGDGQSIVNGLDMGAEDYLIKPVEPILLLAKVRSILRRNRREKVAIFHGNLAKLSFIDLLKFSESNGLTGKIEIEKDQEIYRINFDAGHFHLGENFDEDSTLTKLYDLQEGIFRVYSKSVDFHEIDQAALGPEQNASGTSAAPRPTGILATIHIEGRQYQIQTEYIYPQGFSPRIVSIVTRGQKTLMKRAITPPLGQENGYLERLIQKQHQNVEKEFRDSYATVEKAEPAADSPQERVNQFFELGYEKYRRNDFEGALEAFEEAKKLEPENRTLEVNLQVIRKKMMDPKNSKKAYQMQGN